MTQGSHPADRRYAPRYAATFRVRLAFPDLDAFLTGYAANISKGGIYIPTKQPKPKGTEIRFEILLRDGTVAVSGAGRVAWSASFDPARPGSRYGMGVQFLTIDTASDDIVRKALAWRAKHMSRRDAAREVHEHAPPGADVAEKPPAEEDAKAAATAGPEPLAEAQPPESAAPERAPAPEKRAERPAATREVGEPAAGPAEKAPERAAPEQPAQAAHRKVSLDDVDQLLASLRGDKRAPKPAPVPAGAPPRKPPAEKPREALPPQPPAAEAGGEASGVSAEPPADVLLAAGSGAAIREALEAVTGRVPPSERDVEARADSDIAVALEGVWAPSAGLADEEPVIPIRSEPDSAGEELGASPFRVPQEHLPSQDQLNDLMAAMEPQDIRSAIRSVEAPEPIDVVPEAAQGDEVVLNIDDEEDIVIERAPDIEPDVGAASLDDFLPQIGSDELPGWDEEQPVEPLAEQMRDYDAEPAAVEVVEVSDADVVPEQPAGEIDADDVDLDQILRETVGEPSGVPAAPADGPVRDSLFSEFPQARRGVPQTPDERSPESFFGAPPPHVDAPLDGSADSAPPFGAALGSGPQVVVGPVQRIEGAPEDLDEAATVLMDSTARDAAISWGDASSASVEELPPPPDVAAPIPGDADVSKEKKPGGLLGRLFGKKK